MDYSAIHTVAEASSTEGYRPGPNTPIDETDMKTSYIVCNEPTIEDESFVNIGNNSDYEFRWGRSCGYSYCPLEVKRLTTTAKIPTHGSSEAAGWDIYADEDVTIYPGRSNIVSTGISVCAPTGTYIRLAPRSGLALRNGIDVGAGICDSDYRGEIKVVLFNHTQNTPFEVQRGDRICQMIVMPYIVYDKLTEVTEFTRNSDRGTKGFGSSGIK